MTREMSPASRPPPSSKPRSKLRLLILPFKLLWILFVVMIPLLGVWVVSSLTAFSNGPVWLALVAGLLLFPILPLAWDAWAFARFKKKKLSRPPKIRAGMRIILRTLALNFAVLGGALALWPETAFKAISARGDWMLEQHQEPWAAHVRSVLFFSADRLEWLYNAARENPYQTTPTPTPTPTQTPTPTPTPAVVQNIPPVKTSTGVHWPLEGKLHRLVAEIPASAETSTASIAAFFASHESDEIQRLKAIHDYVADRISYDVESYLKHEYPPQDAVTVLRERKGVCAGYSALFQAIARAAGYEVVNVAGQSRDNDRGDVAGSNHAWSAVKLGDKWYLVDVTWDSGSLSDGKFEKEYRAEYFLTPPDIFVMTHYPEMPKWQLLDPAISRGDFMRQPALRPEFFAKKFRLISPTRSQISVDKSDVEVVIDNPTDQSLLASYNLKDKGIELGERCRINYTLKEAHVLCRLPASGEYRVVLFAADDPLAPHAYVGELEVLARL